MSSYTTGYDEKYKCPYCEKFFTDVDLLIKHSWKCPYCGEYIHIAAPELENGHVLIRKPVSELRSYDSVVVDGHYAYDVIDAVTQKNKVRVALKEFGVKIYSITDFVSVIDGGYYEDAWSETLCQE